MYLWILVVGGFLSFFASMGIGANDAANAFATSIGSKSLSLKQAIFLACIFESAGAILMGSHVVNTIRKGIADYECFQQEPYVLMYGCMWVCFSVGLWLFIASKFEMPVSTTHSCVGAMIGMVFALKGPSCIIWYKPTENFPFIGGVSGIVLSWIISPLFSCLLSSIIFGLLRNIYLRRNNSFQNAIYVFPIIVGFTVTLNTFYIVYKGAKGIDLDEIPLDIACYWSFGIGIGMSLLIIPFIKRYQEYIEDKLNNGNQLEIEMSENNLENEENQETQENLENDNSEVVHNIKMDIDNIIKKDTIVSEIHEKAETFDNKTEELFKYLQIFTAAADAFSHGANDVANAIGPFAAIYMIYRDNELKESNDLGSNAYWILGLGGIGIAIGLFVYGYKIINALGVKLCKITPSRGICIELASALVIITGSRLEIPLSTTHCQVGATVGVSFLEDTKNLSGINKSILSKTIVGWILTLVVASLTTAILVSQGAYAPETNGF